MYKICSAVFAIVAIAHAGIEAPKTITYNLPNMAKLAYPAGAIHKATLPANYNMLYHSIPQKAVFAPAAPVPIPQIKTFHQYPGAAGLPPYVPHIPHPHMAHIPFHHGYGLPAIQFPAAIQAAHIPPPAGIYQTPPALSIPPMHIQPAAQVAQANYPAPPALPVQQAQPQPQAQPEQVPQPQAYPNSPAAQPQASYPNSPAAQPQASYPNSPAAQPQPTFTNSPVAQTIYSASPGSQVTYSSPQASQPSYSSGNTVTLDSGSQSVSPVASYSGSVPSQVQESVPATSYQTSSSGQSQPPPSAPESNTFSLPNTPSQGQSTTILSSGPGPIPSRFSIQSFANAFPQLGFPQVQAMNPESLFPGAYSTNIPQGNQIEQQMQQINQQQQQMSQQQQQMSQQQQKASEMEFEAPQANSYGPQSSGGPESSMAYQ